MTQQIARPKIPIGIESFEELRTDGYYSVDKTLLVRDVLDNGSKTLLFTRPRRFGKTLGLSMLKSFFEKADRDTSVLFQGTEIERASSEYMAHQGKRPVIFLSFKDLAGDSATSIIDGIRTQLKAESERHVRQMLRAGWRDEYGAKEIRGCVSKDATLNEMAMALKTLSAHLHDFHGEKPVVLIDEYDAPVRIAWDKRRQEFRCYESVVDFMRSLLSHTLKTNDNRSYACLTGIDCVAKTAGNSGLNNIRTYTVLDRRFSEYFGFTHKEVRALLDTYGALDRYGEICEWYQGYRFGDTEMFNPLSVLEYLDQGGTPKAYWSLTSMNDTIGEALDYATPEVLADLSRLVNKETVQSQVRDTLVYPRLPGDPEGIFTLLLSAGYLTLAEEQLPPRVGRNDDLTLKIPNMELRRTYEQEIFSRVSDWASQGLRNAYAQLRDAVVTGDAERMRRCLRDLLLKVLGPNDIGGKRKEDAYHMLLTGLLGPLMGSYVLTSNGNAGEGRYDVSLTPMRRHDPGIVIEVKASDDASDAELGRLADKALRQIDEKAYPANPYWEHVGRIFRFGVAFSKKHVEVRFEEEMPRPSQR